MACCILTILLTAASPDQAASRVLSVRTRSDKEHAVATFVGLHRSAR